MIQIDLNLSPKQTAVLKSDFRKVIDFLEQGGSLNTKILENLQKNLSQTVAADKKFVAVLTEIEGSGEFYTVNLCHHDPEILNLPWGMAQDPVSRRMLSELEQLFLTKRLKSARPKVCRLSGAGR